jgi:Heterokaryon incompatibility protein (HET)
MRLLYQDERGGFRFTEDLTDNIPLYAILSHIWDPDGDEVTDDDLKHGIGRHEVGYTKIQFCGRQAKKDHLDYFWVDTCCIDKTSATELAGAINSMFRWYRDATKCYVFLSDVTTRKRDSKGTVLSWEKAFSKSRWFTHGWTL